MMTRLRSTPSWAKIACCISPVRPAAQVWVEIGTPVAFWARAEARRTLSITGVTPAVSVAHLMMAAFTPLVGDALRDVADEQLGHRVDAVGAEVALRHPPHAGGDDDVHARAAGNADDQVDVARRDRRVVRSTSAADAAAVEIGHLPLGDVEDGVAVPEVRPVLLHAGRARDDVLVHQRWSQLGGVHGSAGSLHRCHGRLPRVV